MNAGLKPDMSRLAKAKAANLRVKKIRNTPRLTPAQAQESMALQQIREWRKTRPTYALLDDMVTRCGLMVAALGILCPADGSMSPAIKGDGSGHALPELAQ